MCLESTARSEALESIARLKVAESTARSEGVELEIELRKERLEEHVVALEATLAQEQSARKQLEADTEANAAQNKEAVADILRRLRVLGDCPTCLTLPASVDAGNVAGILAECRQVLSSVENGSKKIKAAQTKGHLGGCFQQCFLQSERPRPVYPYMRNKHSMRG